MQRPQKPIELFFSYAPEDEPFCQELAKHLSLWRRQKIITGYSSRLVAPGKDWTQAMDERVQQASIILLMISPDFMNSDYCWGVEVTKAMEQYKKKQAHVIPILLKSVVWKEALFGHLQPLPTNARPITLWEDQNEAFLNVALGIYQAIEDVVRPEGALVPATRAVLKSSAGHTVLGDTEITIGRAPDNTYIINDGEVSGHHALIHKDGQEYVIIDQRSKNGTFVNHQRLSPLKARTLKQGDLIYIKTVKFEFSDNISVGPAAATRTQESLVGATPETETETIHLRERGLEREQEASSAEIHEELAQALLKQRYKILEMIGRGGMGTVYLAQDTHKENRLVAVKEMSMNSRLTTREVGHAVERFQHEANVLTSLNHPHLPTIYESFEENGSWYLVMSFIEGQNLQNALKAAVGNRLPVDAVVRIGIELCAILEYLHTHKPQVIFRDLKPANIMVKPQGDIYLIDFGIARHFKQGQTKDTTQFCSLGYAPPEQLGQSRTSPRSDIYSLGATLHQMLSGSNPASKLYQFSNLEIVDPMIPRPFAALIAQMLKMEEQDRPASAAEVKKQMEEILASFSEKQDLAPAPLLIPMPDEQPYRNVSLAAQPHVIVDWSVSQRSALSDEEDISDLSGDALAEPQKISLRNAPVFHPARSRFTPSYPADEYVDEYLDVPLFEPEQKRRLSERPSSRFSNPLSESSLSPREVSADDNLFPPAPRRPSERLSSPRVSRYAATGTFSPTRPSPRAGRDVTGAFSPTRPSPRTTKALPDAFSRTQTAPTLSSRSARTVRRGSSLSRIVFLVTVGILLGLCLLLACRFYWPDALLWRLLH